ncbi:MAG: hypothetical protein HQM08_02730 [Candidatus Riflebacteria bacterium]|nr:hypothetical protein [Candidatus Riflebacteria bacterium]
MKLFPEKMQTIDTRNSEILNLSGKIEFTHGKAVDNKGRLDSNQSRTPND